MEGRWLWHRTTIKSSSSSPNINKIASLKATESVAESLRKLLG